MKDHEEITKKPKERKNHPKPKNHPPPKKKKKPKKQTQKKRSGLRGFLGGQEGGGVIQAEIIVKNRSHVQERRKVHLN